MSNKVETTRDIRIKLCEAGRTAAKELITVAEMSIFSGKTDEGKVQNEDLAAEKMKAAAQAKKVAIMDAFDILAKVDEEEQKIIEEDKSIVQKGVSSVEKIEIPEEKPSSKGVESRSL